MRRGSAPQAGQLSGGRARRGGFCCRRLTPTLTAREVTMELPLSHHRRMRVEEFDTRIVLAHAARQARERGYQNFPIIDVDSHHFETEHFSEIVKYIDDPVIRQLLEASSIAC